MKKRKGEPWVTSDVYGRMLPAFTVNLIVADVERSVTFYGEVLQAFVHYSDEDFAAVKVGGTEIMIHADHTYEENPLYARLDEAGVRGAGVELRLFGLDPDAAEERTKAAGATVVSSTVDRAHGWREMMVEDPDGYVWAVGVPTEPGADSRIE